MLSSILNYLEGSVTLLEHTNPTEVRLSDGGVYSAKDFHAMTYTASVLLTRAAANQGLISEEEDPFGSEASTPPPAQVQKPAQDAVPNRYNTHSCNLIISFGKYKGHRMCDINDETWLDWLFSNVQLRAENGKLFTVVTPAVKA